ncbi:hypothetical protein C0J52_01951 [Blattella germanica]|nr:hypothetical protein C0J52_01951 [Blattella germanica]
MARPHPLHLLMKRVEILEKEMTQIKSRLPQETSQNEVSISDPGGYVAERDLRMAAEVKVRSLQTRLLSVERQLQAERELRIVAETKLKTVQDQLKAADSNLTVYGAQAMVPQLNVAIQTEDKIQYDNSVNEKDSRGRTPLSRAANKGNVAQVKELLSLGADVNIANFSGWTPLHVASCNGHVQACNELLSAENVNLNARTNYMWTPLHWASSNGHMSVVKLLLSKGADGTLMTIAGQTAAQIASVKNHKEVSHYIKKFLSFHPPH